MSSIASLLARGRPAACLVVFSCHAVVPAQSADASSEEQFEEHHAHEHGIASLNVAVDGQQLSIEFDSPAVNVIGFEHAPRSEAERAAARKAEAMLRNAGSAFGLPAAAGCRSAGTTLNAPEWHDDHAHADYEATYEFTCQQPAALTQVIVKFIGELSSGTKLRVQLITPSKQASSELSGKNNILVLQ